MKQIVLYSFLLLFNSLFASGQADDVRKQNFNIKNNVEIGGYDVVSYFDLKPREGKAEFNSTYKGVTYFFANKTNLEKFKAAPAGFEPAYGGWCAFAMGDTGEKVKIDPETYKIESGKLYLFYNFWGNNTLKDWNKNEKVLKLKGDTNWARILH